MPKLHFLLTLECGIRLRKIYTELGINDPLLVLRLYRPSTDTVQSTNSLAQLTIYFLTAYTTAVTTNDGRAGLTFQQNVRSHP